MLWGGYTVKILISGTAKYEQFCSATWFMGPIEAPCSLCGVVSCLITLGTFNRSIFQICNIQAGCLAWLRALFSPLLFPLQKIAGDTDVNSLEAGRSWTQSSSSANRFGITVLTYSNDRAGGERIEMVKWPVELFIHVAFCSSFTHFWTMINTYSGLGLVWTRFLPMCLACYYDSLAISFPLHFFTLKGSGSENVWFCSLWEHKKCYSLIYCNKYSKLISSLASLIRN